MHRDLAGVVDDNLRDTLVTLAEHAADGAHRQFGALTAVDAGVPVPIYNRVLVLEPPSTDDLAAAVDWLTERAVPFWVTVADPALDAFGDRRGSLDRDLVEIAEHPGMALHPLEVPPDAPSGAAITEVRAAEDLAAFSRVAASAFDVPTDAQRQVDRVALETTGLRPFLGTVDGEPAACGLLVRTGDVAGVYTIGVRPTFRRQGLGEAITWAVLRAGREAGCSLGVLQASELATPLYDEMGFETVTTYHQFDPSPPASGDGATRSPNGGQPDQT